MKARRIVAEFDEVIHAPVRLRIVGLLRRMAEVEFAVVRDALGVSDATLSKNVRQLVQAGYVVVRKDSSPNRIDARRLTWLGLTEDGRRALEGHLAALVDIASGEG